MLHNLGYHHGTDVASCAESDTHPGAGVPIYTCYGPQAVEIEIVINGKPRTVILGMTVAQLIADLGFADQRVAVERNREVVPRAQHATTELAPSDRLEIVTFVGGGL